MSQEIIPFSKKTKSGYTDSHGRFRRIKEHESIEKPDHIKFHNLKTQTSEHVHVDNVKAQQLKNKKMMLRATSSDGKTGLARILPKST
jgi:hypothetical protein